MAAERNALINWLWQIHPKLYRWSNGRIGGAIIGMPVLLLTTTGRKSGLARTRALMYLPHGQDFVVIASNLGADYHPAWWLNLEAEPAASVQVSGKHYLVRAREAEGEEREQLWRSVVQTVADYEKYQASTRRRIPVVVLERQD